MSDRIIIYPNNIGGVVFCYPAANCQLSVEEIARKDVPKDVPYFIVNNDILPQDYTFFEAFEADFSNPDGYGIGAEEWFAEQKLKEIE